jgi:hypothetical protein
MEPLLNAAGAGWAMTSSPPAGVVYVRRHPSLPIAMALDAGAQYVIPHLQLRAELPPRIVLQEMAAPLLVFHAGAGVLVPLTDRMGPFEISTGPLPMFFGGAQIWPTRDAPLFADLGIGVGAWRGDPYEYPLPFVPVLRIYLGWGW